MGKIATWLFLLISKQIVLCPLYVREAFMCCAAEKVKVDGDGQSSAVSNRGSSIEAPRRGIGDTHPLALIGISSKNAPISRPSEGETARWSWVQQE